MVHQGLDPSATEAPLQAVSVAPPDEPVLLVTPRARLSTSAVFAAWDAAPDTHGAAADAVERLIESFAAGMTGEALASRAGELRDANDLWRPAAGIVPEPTWRNDAGSTRAAARIPGIESDQRCVVAAGVAHGREVSGACSCRSIRR